MTTSTATAALYNKEDHSSLSNPTQVTVTHINIEWTIDFSAKTFSGLVDHSVKVLAEGTAEVHFDSSRLHLLSAEEDGEMPVCINRTEWAEYRVEETHPVLGTRIAVSIPPTLRAAGSEFVVSFRYAIDAQASAVQWLAAEATKGGARPFVFTQCQAIHARSLLPCMDSPAVKTTYTAAVTAPQWCTVLMSALADGERETANGMRTFLWRQPVPTPAYLIALAAGRVESRDVSARVRIWAEPEVIAAAHYEFDETEDFVRIAEEITGCPYQWTRYDVVCLPPSFPYGGMENPCLTFATPTLLAGDKSLADVIAHEIAHSWTGNLVTNHSWDHFWLNEGWTVWLERKISSKFKKNREVGVLSAQIGYKDLQESVEKLSDATRFTRLVWPLRGEDPDDAFSSVPYEKGFNLLNQLETIVGTELFESFAQRYIDTFKFRTVTTGEFRDCFVAFVHEKLDAKPIAAAEGEDGTHAEGTSEKAKTAKKNKKKGKTAAPAPAAAAAVPVVHEISAEHKLVLEKVDALDWEQLFLSEGMPAFVPNFENSLSAAAQALAQRWIAAANTESESDEQFAQFSAQDINGWTSAQLCLFLEALQRNTQAWELHTLQRIDALYSLTVRLNAEIRLRWQMLCLRADAEWIVPHVVDFITSQGRMKFVRPLYRALRLSRVGGKKAQAVFDAHKHVYHPIARKMLESDLAKLALIPGIDDEEEEAEAKTETVQTSEESENDTAPTAAAAAENEKELVVQTEDVPVVVVKEEETETLSAAATTAEASPTATAEEETDVVPVSVAAPVAVEPEPVAVVEEEKEVAVPVPAVAAAEENIEIVAEPSVVEETVTAAPEPVVVEVETVPAPVADAVETVEIVASEVVSSPVKAAEPAIAEEPVVVTETVAETVSEAVTEAATETVSESVVEAVTEEPAVSSPVKAEPVVATPVKSRTLTEEDSQPASEPQQSPVPTPKPAQKSVPVEEAQSATPLAKLNVNEEVKHATAPVPAPAASASPALTPIKEEKNTPPATATPAPTPVKEEEEAPVAPTPAAAAKPSCCGGHKKEKESTAVSTQRSFFYLYLLGVSGIVGFYLFRTLSRRR